MKTNPYQPRGILPVTATPVPWHLHARLGGWILATTGVMAVLTALMPPGFAGVPYTLLLIVAFFSLFVACGLFEESIIINAITIVVFWLVCAIWHAMNLGSAPGRPQRFVDGLLLILVLASIHLSIQTVPKLLRHARDTR